MSTEKLKTCSQCKKSQNMDQYISCTDSSETKMCTDCRKTSQKKKINSYGFKQTQEYLVDIKSKNPCSMCGDTNISHLEFNHNNPEEKTECVTAIKNLEKLKEELKKCSILCGKCHAKITKIQYDTHQVIPKGEIYSNSAYATEVAHIQKNKEFVFQKKIEIGGCQNPGCTDIFDSSVLPFYQFDHIDPKTKLKSIAYMMQRKYSQARMVEEMEKCLLLCLYCHREKTKLQQAERTQNAYSGQPMTKICTLPPKTKELDDEIVIKIRNLYQKGNISQPKLAEKFNTNRSVVADVISFRSYKHVGGAQPVKTIHCRDDDTSVITNLVKKPKLAPHALFPNSQTRPEIFDQLMIEYDIYQNDTTVSLAGVARKLKVSPGFVKTHFATIEKMPSVKTIRARHPLFPRSNTKREVFDELIKEYEIHKNEPKVNYSAIARKLNVSSWFVTDNFARLEQLNH